MIFITLLALVSSLPAPSCSMYEQVNINSNQTFNEFIKENSSNFPINPSLRPAVNFWKAVFNKYNSTQEIIHDKNTYTIYAIIDLPMINKNVDERASKKIIKKYLQDYAIKLKNNNLRGQRGVQDHFDEGIVNYLKLKPTIITILKEASLPYEIVALPFLESGFNPKAISYCHATGLWQIMRFNLKFLGLKANRKT